MRNLSCGQQALAFVAAGRVEEALGLIDSRAANGEAEAWLVRALWRIEGQLLARDLSRARDELLQADELGHAGAARIYAGMLASGAGGRRDWRGAVGCLERWAGDDPIAKRQAELIAAMPLTETGDPRLLPEPEILLEAPHVARVSDLFSAEECGFLVELAAARLKPALIFHEQQRRFVRDPIRDSHAAGFPLVSEWPFVHALNRRIAAATGTDAAQGEPLQILRYAVGQQYRPHLDAIPGLANQRRLTVVVYLTDNYEGGETHFPESALKVCGRLGDALIFANALPDGRPDPASRHAGCPVLSGEKIIASRWIRDHVPSDPNERFGQHEAER